MTDSSSPKPPKPPTPPLRLVAVDTGGTFTDLVCVREGRVQTHKLLSTPDDPSRAVLEGLRALDALHAQIVVHGTTVATNALLERRGAITAFVTTSGFEDLLALARQNRPDVYALYVAPRPPRVAAERCFGLPGRLGPSGAVESPLKPESFAELASSLQRSGTESIALCLLHSYANPSFEADAADRLRAALSAIGHSADITCSSDVCPEFREYERATTTVANASVRPLVARYVRRLAAGLPQSKLRIVLSNGGCVSAERAAEVPVLTALSGPAAGVVGAIAAAQAAGFSRVLAFDMGGTSTDVTFCRGTPPMARSISVGDDALPLRMASLDIHTVGAGGGSIAWIDAGGGLHAGPRSAGADPGPACYGRGGVEATVTDANLVRGHLVADAFLGGAMPLDEAAARAAVQRVADQLGTSALEAADGIARVANAVMERALRTISLQRGHDPRDAALLTFGGAGGMHACELAEALQMRAVVVPPHPGLLSAVGMLHSDTRFDLTQTLLARLTGTGSAAGRRSATAAFAELRRRAVQWLDAEEIPANRRRVETTASLRYRGQSFEIEVDWSRADEAAQAFHDAHRSRYGYAVQDGIVELVAARAAAIGRAEPPQTPLRAPTPHVAQPSGSTPLGWPLYRRETLEPGARIKGPAIVVEYSSTTAIRPGWQADLVASGAMVLLRADR